MPTITLDKPLTNLQAELLRLFSRNLPEERLLSLNQVIADYYYLPDERRPPTTLITSQSSEISPVVSIIASQSKPPK